MKKKALLFFISMLAVALAPAICSAADVSEEEVTPRSKKIYLEPQKSMIDRGTLRYLIATTQGFDNNSHLSSQRDQDFYFQNFFRATFTAPVNNNKKTEAMVGYELMNLMYAGQSDLDLLRNGLQAGISHNFSKDLNLTVKYYFDSIEYINSGNDDYLDNQIEFKLRKKLPHKMYHSVDYSFLYRDYGDRRIRLTASTYSDKKRVDERNTFGYEIGKYLDKDLLKVTCQYFYNNSNERYLNYYDYDSYKIGASLTHLFTEKFTGYVSLSRQYRDFRSRSLVNDPKSLENERTYLMTTGLYYTLNQSLSFGLHYTYRQNNSNEPAEEYSGSLFSFSTYYRF